MLYEVRKIAADMRLVNLIEDRIASLDKRISDLAYKTDCQKLDLERLQRYTGEAEAFGHVFVDEGSGSNSRGLYLSR